MTADSNHAIGTLSQAMKRSGWIIGVVVIQAMWMLVLVALPIYLLVLARSSVIVNDPDGPDAAHGLRVGAVVLAVPAIFAIASSYGLWKEKLWGWWVGLLSNTAMLGTLIYSMTDENSIDWDMAGVMTFSAVLPLLLLVPAVRKFYWHGRKSA
jgi:Predicted membrane protein (DUF2127)